MEYEIDKNEQVARGMITRSAAAELAGVDVRTIDRWANEGRITRYKIGGMQWVRFRETEIQLMLTPLPERAVEPVPDDPFAD